jgi:hypothetical protein
MQWYLAANTNHTAKLMNWCACRMSGRNVIGCTYFEAWPVLTFFTINQHRLGRQREWMQAQISQHGPASEDAFWAAQALIWEQLTGMVAGYNAAVHASTPGDASYQHQKTNTLKPLTFADLHLLNSFGRCSLQCIMIPGTPSTRTQIF